MAFSGLTPLFRLFFHHSKNRKDIGKHTNTHYIQQEYTQALVYNITQSSLFSILFTFSFIFLFLVRSLTLTYTHTHPSNTMNFLEGTSKIERERESNKRGERKNLRRPRARKWGAHDKMNGIPKQPVKERLESTAYYYTQACINRGCTRMLSLLFFLFFPFGLLISFWEKKLERVAGYY